MNSEIERLEILIAKFLRYGVLFSGLLMLSGWLSTLRLDESLFANPLAKYSVYKTEPLNLQLHEAIGNHQWGVILTYCGLSVLISLPVLRVLLTSILFMKMGDKILAAIAASVLLVLIFSFALGFEL